MRGKFANVCILGKKMPAKSRAQAGFFGAELARKKAGKKTKTKMTESQLSEYLEGSKLKGLPLRVKKKKLKRRKHAK